jgi:glycosyltransferase involved in cell wall biosynthesis
MSPAQPAVSVVLPTYNRETSIRTAVNSVLGQTFVDLELIVVDDCSNDGTVAVLETIDDPRLRVIRHARNAGGSAARNTGLAAARGPWVAFQDSDDEWLAAKLERQMQRLSGLGQGWVGCYCGMLVVNAPLNPSAASDRRPSVRYVPSGRGPRPEGDMLERLLAQSLISTQTLVARREALEAIGGFDPEMPALQDWDCVLRLARLGRIALVDEPLVLQRFSSDSLSRSWRNRLTARRRIVEKNGDLLRERPSVLAEHYHTIAGAHYAIGETRESRRWLRQALRLAPFRLRSWANLLRSAVSTGPRADATAK